MPILISEKWSQPLKKNSPLVILKCFNLINRLQALSMVNIKESHSIQLWLDLWLQTIRLECNSSLPMPSLNGESLLGQLTLKKLENKLQIHYELYMDRMVLKMLAMEVMLQLQLNVNLGSFFPAKLWLEYSYYYLVSTLLWKLRSLYN